jgi:CHAD domain-containing protein
MAYRIRNRMPLDQELKRVFSERLDDSIQWLGNPEQDLDEAIHEVRKNMKKIRGLLRLFRYTLPCGIYRNLNGFCRDFSRKFARAREARVHLNTIKKLENKNQFPPAASSVVDLLQSRYNGILNTLTDQKEFFALSCLELQDSKEQIVKIDIDPSTKQMCKGIKRVYRRGRKAMQMAKKHPNARNFHEWRKRVKYLWYHIGLLQDAWPAVMKGYRRTLDKLSGDLGLEHDLSELQQLILESDLLGVIPETDKHDLSSAVEKSRMEARSGIWLYGDRQYTEKPGAFAGRIMKYWKVTANA